MPTQNEFTADPDGQVLMNVLTELEVAPGKAYNATQAVRNMSGREVIARIDTFEASVTARIDGLEASTTARIDALEASTNARIDAFEASTNARIDALESTTSTHINALEASTNAQIDALEAITTAQHHALNAQSAQSDMLAWGVGATFMMVMALTAVGLINLVASQWPWGRHSTGSPSKE